CFSVVTYGNRGIGLVVGRSPQFPAVRILGRDGRMAFFVAPAKRRRGGKCCVRLVGQFGDLRFYQGPSQRILDTRFYSQLFDEAVAGTAVIRIDSVTMFDVATHGGYEALRLPIPRGNNKTKRWPRRQGNLGARKIGHALETFG